MYVCKRRRLSYRNKKGGWRKLPVQYRLKCRKTYWLCLHNEGVCSLVRAKFHHCVHTHIHIQRVCMQPFSLTREFTLLKRIDNAGGRWVLARKRMASRFKMHIRSGIPPPSFTKNKITFLL